MKEKFDTHIGECKERRNSAADAHKEVNSKEHVAIKPLPKQNFLINNNN